MECEGWISFFNHDKWNHKYCAFLHLSLFSRQLELIAAQWTPLSEENRISVVHREHYPFVFDASLANGESNLIVNGMKVSLIGVLNIRDVLFIGLDELA